MINPAEYQTLYKCDKARLLRCEGEFVGAIETIGYRTSLYILNGFYVEVSYSYINKEIEAISVIDDIKRLELYTMNMSLGNLIVND